MTYTPHIHHRSSIRLKGYDYSSAGAYFVTVCTDGRACLFGHIAEGEMQMNDAGLIVKKVWSELPERFPHLIMDTFVIMPNHFHGIIVITDPVGALLAAPEVAAPEVAAPEVAAPEVAAPEVAAPEVAAPEVAAPEVAAPDAIVPSHIEYQLKNKGTENKGTASGAPTVGKIIRVFKSISGIEVNKLLDRQGRPLWQRNYYERIIRNDEEFSATREYILSNPLRWEDDEEYIP